jgi:MoxR-like ATPase
MNTGISAINEQVQEAASFVRPLFGEIGKVIIGQTYLVERLVIGLLANGHVLLEGVPGLAKTLSVKTLANCLNVKFSRLQFTPDMLPADVIGTQIYNPQSGAFTTRRGPIFANLVLADEINRAPAKVQSALLEAMQEKQVTIGEQTYKLEEPFSGFGNAESDRTGRNLSVAGGAGGPLHAETEDRLSIASRGAPDPGCDGPHV